MKIVKKKPSLRRSDFLAHYLVVYDTKENCKYFVQIQQMTIFLH